MDEVSEQLGLSLIKQLACCHKTTRGRALRHLLKIWLPSQTRLPEDDMKKLWKGIFYCVWHADKVPVQAELINRLSSLIVTVDVPLSIQYFSVFLLTMRREWNGIDALRLDKFYLLIRRFMHNFFLLMKNNTWDLDLTKSLMCLLEQNTFFAEDKFHGNGVNYHIASVFLEELKPFLPVRLEVLEVLLKPFIDVMGKLPDKVLLRKIKSNVFDVLLRMGIRLLQAKKSGDDVDSVDDAVVYGTIPLVLGFSKRFFEVGASAECCQGNRKILFGLNQMFLKLEKDLESSGLEISIPEVSNHEEDEVPVLVPVVNAMEADASIAGNESEIDKAVRNDLNENQDKPLKKCKRKKSSGGSGKNMRKQIKDMHSDSKNICNDEDAICHNGENLKDQSNEGVSVTLDEFVISNLQRQFEKVAAEAGLENEVGSAFEGSECILNGVTRKKRKRTKSRNVQLSHNSEAYMENTEVNTAGKSADKSSKKVKFSMKNNLVWKPQNPLPPQSLRLPPSVAPRGSALKKGVPPGPVRVRVVNSSTKKKKIKKAKKTV